MAGMQQAGRLAAAALAAAMGTATAEPAGPAILGSPGAHTDGAPAIACSGANIHIGQPKRDGSSTQSTQTGSAVSIAIRGGQIAIAVGPGCITAGIHRGPTHD